jgi:hypothetical protein
MRMGTDKTIRTKITKTKKIYSVNNWRQTFFEKLTVIKETLSNLKDTPNTAAQ